MYGADGAAGLALSANQLENIDHFGDGSLDDNVEPFLSHDGGDGRDLYGTLKQNLTRHKTEFSNGFSFDEVGCIRTRNKATCCHLSSDGNLLASAGHDKKEALIKKVFRMF
ncbi:transcriptional corepressor LEUNIG_HOMOLOG-like isoform X2 [Actinidia eriantha]|uniref:transcriptional corepressor LEUNIG_HOMOLOG-like isoform X2 n=1 Tax=Actinidia eriantha TaxID=165200 RepID=UPI002588BC9F|nr:transcriptional corepressor LEUNIG_HOMOLOG-like isoform X2 [Actinidia eriantha]